MGAFKCPRHNDLTLEVRHGAGAVLLGGFLAREGGRGGGGKNYFLHTPLLGPGLPLSPLYPYFYDALVLSYYYYLFALFSVSSAVFFVL